MEGVDRLHSASFGHDETLVEHEDELHLALEACHLMKMKLENVERDNLLGLHYCLPDQILRHDRKIPETRLVEVDNTFVAFETVNSQPGLNS